MRGWLYLPLLLLCSCGAVSVSGGFQSTDVTEVGLVSFVQFTAISDGEGSLVNVTIVTLTEPGVSHNVVLCGNQHDAFAVNTFVRTRFRPGKTCGSILLIFIEQHG
jgi:hypothetical protein